MGYILIYLHKGKLPWQGLKANGRRDRYEKIMESKVSTPVDVLCKDYPDEFHTYISYCKGIEFDYRPDYSFLRRLLKDVFVRENYHLDPLFDWITLSRKVDDIDEEIEADPVSPSRYAEVASVRPSQL